MKAVVTGAGGQLGAALLAAAPEAVSVVAATARQLDVSSAAAVDRFLDEHRPDIVLNAAAFTAVDAAEAEPERARAVNDTGVGNLVEAAARIGAHVAHVSTDYVFDGRAERPYRPHDTTAPLGTYGRTKRAGEARLRESDLLVRTAWVHGAQAGTYVTTMLRLMREHAALDIVTDQRSTPTSAHLLAKALWQLAIGKQAGTFHFTDSGSASRFEFTEAILEEALAIGLLKTPVRLLPVPSSAFAAPARRPAYSVLDCSSTYAALGWTPPSWRDGLRRSLEGLSLHA